MMYVSHCGKRIELTAEQARTPGATVVCPECRTTVTLQNDKLVDA